MARKRKGPTPPNPARAARAALAEALGIAETEGSDVDTVRRLVLDRDGLQGRIDTMVQRCREGGATWVELAAALGVSPQAVQKRYGR